MVSSGSPCLAVLARRPRSPRIAPSVRSVLWIGRSIATLSPRSSAGAASSSSSTSRDALEIVDERLAPVVVDRVRALGAMEERREVEAARLPVRDGAVRLQSTRRGRSSRSRGGSRGAPCTRALPRRRTAGSAPRSRACPRSACAASGSWRRDAHRAGVQVADAHQDAAQRHERRGGEAELVGAEQRRDHDVAPGLESAVGLHADAAAQVVQHQRLLGLGEADLPGHAGVLDRGERRRAGAAVVAADQHAVRAALRDARRDRADARPPTPASPRRARAGWRSSGRRSAGRDPRSSRCRDAAAARSGRRRASSAAPWRSSRSPCGRAAAPPSPGLAPWAILICSSSALTRYQLVTPKRPEATCLMALRRESPLASGVKRSGSSPPSPVLLLPPRRFMAMARVWCASRQIEP